MKHAGYFCALIVLMLILATSAFAGQVSCPPAAEPSQPLTLTGQMPSGDVSIGDMHQPLAAAGAVSTGATTLGEVDCPMTAMLLLSLTLGL